MEILLSPKTAGNILLTLMFLLLLFHILVMLQILPSNIVWGGRFEDSSSDRITLEIIALAVTVLFMLIIVVKTGYIKAGKLKKPADYGMWIIVAYLALNSLANFFSDVPFENFFFGPLTVLMTLLALRLAVSKK
jgi:hypothetical protein